MSKKNRKSIVLDDMGLNPAWFVLYFFRKLCFTFMHLEMYPVTGMGHMFLITTYSYISEIFISFLGGQMCSVASRQ